MGGSVLNWSKSLTEILKLDFDTAIPGHGNNPLTKADVQAFQKKLAFIGSKGIELRKKGVAKEEIRQQIQAAGAAELGTWMVNGIINDMRLDMFYADLRPPRNKFPQTFITKTRRIRSSRRSEKDLRGLRVFVNPVGCRIENVPRNAEVIRQWTILREIERARTAWRHD